MISGAQKNIGFVAESTLGKLAKWLRMLGFDTVFEKEPSAAPVHEPERVRLTRRRRFLKKPPPGRVIFIMSDKVSEQVKEVVTALELTPADITPFTRCLRCNASIQPAGKSWVFGKVPDYIFDTQDTFQTCPQCNRIYWPGSHTGQSMERIRKLFTE